MSTNTSNDNRKYPPIRVPFTLDGGKTDEIGLYGAQAKFLYRFALSTMKVTKTGGAVLIAAALICEAIKWASRDICRDVSAAIRGEAERKGRGQSDSEPDNALEDALNHAVPMDEIEKEEEEAAA